MSVNNPLARLAMTVFPLAKDFVNQEETLETKNNPDERMLTELLSGLGKCTILFYAGFAVPL